MSFTDQLLKDGLFSRILNLLDQLNESDELAALEKGRAVGGARHRRQIVELIRDQRACLADCLFLWCVQTPPTLDHTLQIITHIKKIKLAGGNSPSTQSDTGGQSSSNDVAKVTVDVVTVSLCMTVLACFNIGEGEIDEVSNANSHYPLLSDPTFLPTVHAEVTNVSLVRV